ncbi:MAG: RNA polymerase sigma factor [Gammaproteobacteria bacterium]|nr:RNA polymerase sigma factor [Gammaproteobacteria bacterium]
MELPLRASTTPSWENLLESNQALDRFLAGAERRALAMARAATRHSDDALDIVQDAMLQLVRYYAGRPEGEWGPLFQQILQRRIYDWYRRTRVRNRWRQWFSDDDEDAGNALENQPDPRPTGPQEQSAANRTLVALEAAVARLPLRQQQAFLLRTWEGLDVEQTARAMGCSAGSVKTHYFRAVQSLQNQLKDHWQP